MVCMIERSRFEPWLGHLCCIRGRETLFQQCLSPPRRETDKTAVGLLAMNSHPHPGELSIYSPREFSLMKLIQGLATGQGQGLNVS